MSIIYRNMIVKIIDSVKRAVATIRSSLNNILFMRIPISI